TTWAESIKTKAMPKLMYLRMKNVSSSSELAQRGSWEAARNRKEEPGQREACLRTKECAESLTALCSVEPGGHLRCEEAMRICLPTSAPVRLHDRGREGRVQSRRACGKTLTPVTNSLVRMASRLC